MFAAYMLMCARNKFGSYSIFFVDKPRKHKTWRNWFGEVLLRLTCILKQLHELFSHYFTRALVKSWERDRKINGALKCNSAWPLRTGRFERRERRPWRTIADFLMHCAPRDTEKHIHSVREMFEPCEVHELHGKIHNCRSSAKKQNKSTVSLTFS